MKTSEIPRGQLSTVILSSLLGGDKYGYEIIESVQNATDGEFVIKKPSLYSTLARMEKQDLVSSYWQDSDIGGRRHYYRLTDYGKKQVLQWQEQLYSSQTKLAQILQKNKAKHSPDQSKKPESLSMFTKNEKEPESLSTPTEDNKKSDTFLKQENLFDLTKTEDIKDVVDNTTNLDQENNQNSTPQDYIQYDLFSDSSYVTTPENTVGLKDEESVLNTKKQIDDSKKTPSFTTSQTNQSFKIEEQPTSHEEKVSLFKESINEILKKETAVFEERLQTAKKSFNFETEYKKYLKSTKSYTEAFDPNSKDNSHFKESYTPFATQRDIKNTNENGAAKSYLHFEQKDDINEKLHEKNTLKKLHNQFTEFSQDAPLQLKQQNFSNANTIKNKDFITASITQQTASNQAFNFENLTINQEESINENFDKSNEDAETNKNFEQASIMITDRLDDATKVKRIEPASFSNLNNSKLPKKQVSEEKLFKTNDYKILKDNDDTNSSSQEKLHIPAEEYFEKLKISIGKYSKNRPLQKARKTFKTSGKKDYINKKKFNLIASGINFGLIFIQTLAIILILNLQSINHSPSLWLIISTAFVCCAWLAYSLTSYLKNKDEKVLKKNILTVPLWQKLVLIAIFLILIYSVHIVAGLNLENILSFAITLALPLMFCFNVLLYHFFQLLILKK